MAWSSGKLSEMSNDVVFERIRGSFNDLKSWLVPALQQDNFSQYRSELGSIQVKYLQATDIERGLSNDRFFHCKFDQPTVISISDHFLSQWTAYHCRKETEFIARNPDSHSQEMFNNRLSAQLQMFFIHELLHVQQELGSENYQDSDKGPDVLQTVDYAADAISILALFSRWSESNKIIMLDPNGDWCSRLAALIETALWGMEFFHYGEDGASPPEKGLGFYTWTRLLTWNLNYFRCLNFNADLSADALHLDIPPSVNVRGLRPYERRLKYINDKPPPRPTPLKESEIPGVSERERYKQQAPLLWVAAPDRNGLPLISRHYTTDPAKERHFYEGMKNSDRAAIGELLRELLTQRGNEHLTGYDRTVDYSQSNKDNPDKTGTIDKDPSSSGSPTIGAIGILTKDTGGKVNITINNMHVSGEKPPKD